MADQEAGSGHLMIEIDGGQYISRFSVDALTSSCGHSDVDVDVDVSRHGASQPCGSKDAA